MVAKRICCFYLGPEFSSKHRIKLHKIPITPDPGFQNLSSIFCKVILQTCGAYIHSRTCTHKHSHILYTLIYTYIHIHVHAHTHTQIKVK